MSAGNDNLHVMTFDKRQRMRVDLGDWENKTAYAEYDHFIVAGAATKYVLASTGRYAGTASE